MPHLKTRNREATGVVHWSDNRNQVWAVGYVLVVKLHRNLIITWKRRREEGNSVEHISKQPTGKP